MTLLSTLVFSGLVSVTLFVVTPPVGRELDAQTPRFQSVITLLKINILHITPWRFGSDHFPFQVGDDCRFHLNIQG